MFECPLVPGASQLRQKSWRFGAEATMSNGNKARSEQGPHSVHEISARDQLVVLSNAEKLCRPGAHRGAVQ